LLLAGFLILVVSQPKQWQPGAPPMVEVRRALPAVPRALPVTAAVADPQIGQWHAVTFSNGASMQIYDRGWLASTALLPARGGFVGDAYVVNHHYWIWQQPANGPASWIDP
jgi:hypothetical protein